ncbi:MAG: aminoglycoside phosphotransferase family protein [Bacteroidales bacterium]|nr:aminoglycoside phosphotransferase family protein [Bacteroidota bacterium]MBL6950602.1 aminoglycoside phosphotransferase family protein [Bacteroidales bacterium]
MNELSSILSEFSMEGSPIYTTPIGSGHINDSYLIKTSPEYAPDYVLQRINHQIFKDIPGLMKNINVVTRYIRNKLDIIEDNHQEMQVLELIPTQDDQLFYNDPTGNYWRLYYHISGSHSYDRIENAELAYKGGRAFGQFQTLTAGIDPEILTVTIPRFHDITWRLGKFDEVLKIDPVNRAHGLSKEIEFVLSRSGTMRAIHELGSRGDLPLRITHNDTKFNNILFDDENNAVCIIDLDTVMPGYSLYDFGDAIRTGANTGAEDDAILENVGIDLKLFAAYAKGFLKVAGPALTRNELDHLAFSAKFMTFIIGLRFFTDHINGDNYYKIHFPGHNLQRARAQFKLLESMEAQFNRMREIIGELVRW